MNEKQTNTMPKEMASAANLMVHPLAGAAALSALGVGLASQTFGIWMGAWAGAAEVSQRLFLPDDAAGGASGSARQARKAEAAAAKADETRALIEKTKALAAAKARPAPAGKPPREKAVAAAKVVPIAAAKAQEAPAAIMPEDFRQPKAAERPAMPDDLKAIPGIGPKVEQVLNGVGVWTYAQVAGWTPQEVAWVEDALGFKGRIGRDGWLAQAAKLAGAGTKQ